jgi:hypothetical protein
MALQDCVIFDHGQQSWIISEQHWVISLCGLDCLTLCVLERRRRTALRVSLGCKACSLLLFWYGKPGNFFFGIVSLAFCFFGIGQPGTFFLCYGKPGTLFVFGKTSHSFVLNDILCFCYWQMVLTRFLGSVFHSLGFSLLILEIKQNQV